jgi:hypothetical protein
VDNDQTWPALPHAEWRETLDTLHMYLQVLGKLRLALSPFEVAWANVPLYVTARGLTTSLLPYGLRTFDGELDLIDHAVMLRSGEGMVERVELGSSVADYYGDVVSALRRMRIEVEISTMPSEVPHPIPFPDDHIHVTYDREHATLFHRVISMIDVVMREHRAHFNGWTQQVHFFWGTFDMALARFNGRRITPRPDAAFLEKYGATEEMICCGWWPGDEQVPFACFYAYAHPMPNGFSEATILPSHAGWDSGVSEFLLRYDAAVAEPDPRRSILDFFASTYDAAARLGNWDADLTDLRVPPSHLASCPQHAQRYLTR